MIKVFLFLYDFFRDRKPTLIVVFFIAISAFLYFASKVKFEEDITEMLPVDSNNEQLSAFVKSSKFSDRIIVTFSLKNSTPDPDRLVQAADDFVEKLNDSLAAYISSISYKTDDSSMLAVLDLIEGHLPIFLNDDDYLLLDSITSPEGIKSQVESNYRNLISPSGIGLRKFISSDPIGINFIVFKKLGQFQSDDQVQLYDNHFLSSDSRNLLLFINPAYPSGETEKNSTFFKGMDELIASSVHDENDIAIKYFGGPAVSAGNAARIRADTFLTVSVTVVLLLLMFIWYFKSLRAPFVIMIPVMFGGLFALAVVYLVKGSISVIALGAGSLVLGIAVNYSLHFLTHHRFHPNVRNTIRELAFPMTVGSLTTVGGFLCLQFVNAPVLQDLGLYAAMSLIGAAMASLIFLPHFIGKINLNRPAPGLTEDTFISKTMNKLSGNKYVFIGIILITPIFFYFAKDVRFETDMYKINYMSPQLKEAEKFVNSLTSKFQKSVFTVTEGTTLDHALVNSEEMLPHLQKLKSQGKILSYTNIATILPSRDEQQRRIETWERFWTDNKRSEVFNTLVAEGERFRFKESAFESFNTQTTINYSLLSEEKVVLLRTLFLDMFIEEKNDKVTLAGFVLTTPKYTDEVYETLSGSPSTIMFDRKYLTDKLVEMVSDDFNFITLWTSLLVLAALFLIYGRIELAVISFLPMALSWIWILGIMAMFDIKFNIVNIVLSTFIFALGDDYCIFTTDSLQQAYAKRIAKLRSTTTSITLSAITTVIGMGVLIFAKHPALNSIALVSIIGIFSVWFLSQILQPVLFRFMITNPSNSKHEPYTFFNIIKSVFAFSYFITGSLLISGIGFIMFKIFPGRSAGKKYVYHVILSNFARSMIYIMANVNKRIINSLNEDFSKPAVIIANHTSFLDILLLVMLHPKLILLTNKWVWNSPVFGLAVRLAEYYPVAEGAENTIGKLSDKVKEGYSIVVFPEGTRSVDGTIGRFHKGAFYLSEQLNIDILPIVIHGAHHTMTKGFFYLKNGFLTLKYLPRIHPDNKEFGNTYSERAKLVGRYFRSQHQLLRKEAETPEYFRKQIYSNFIYKGPVLEWYMKVKMKLENNYKLFDQLIPKEGKIIDMGCGYGFLSYMLALTGQGRSVTGVDYDEEKIEIARWGYLRGENLSFINSDILDFKFDRPDVVLLNDVLHYLRTMDQHLLLESIVNNLADGGMIMIRDGVSELKARHKGTRISEMFSTRLLGFNKTKKHGLNFISSEMIHNLAAKFNMKIEVIDNTRLTSNLVFILRKS